MNARPRVDMELLRRDLPPGFDEAIRRAGTNVEAAVNEMIDEYEKQLKGHFGQLEKGIATQLKQFDADLSNAQNEFATEIKGIKTDILAEVGKAIKVINKLNVGQASQALTDAATELGNQQKTLDEKVNNFVKQAGELGGKVGGAVGTAGRAFVKTMAPVP